jgi:hypothetical protein
MTSEDRETVIAEARTLLDDAARHGWDSRANAYGHFMAAAPRLVRELLALVDARERQGIEPQEQDASR